MSKINDTLKRAAAMGRAQKTKGSEQLKDLLNLLDESEMVVETASKTTQRIPAVPESTLLTEKAGLSSVEADAVIPEVGAQIALQADTLAKDDDWQAQGPDERHTLLGGAAKQEIKIFWLVLVFGVLVIFLSATFLMSGWKGRRLNVEQRLEIEKLTAAHQAEVEKLTAAHQTELARVSVERASFQKKLNTVSDNSRDRIGKLSLELASARGEVDVLKTESQKMESREAESQRKIASLENRVKESGIATEKLYAEVRTLREDVQTKNKIISEFSMGLQTDSTINSTKDR